MVEIVGLTELQAALASWPAAVTGMMQRASQEAASAVKPDLQAYPPPRGYDRTYKLKGGWGGAVVLFEGSGFAFTATLTNPVMYGPYVQGSPEDDPHQAWMHRGVWDTTQAILDDDAAKIEQVYADWSQDLVDAIG